MISVEKPGSPAEILEHFGTKGMRWGVRNKDGSKSLTGLGPNLKVLKTKNGDVFTVSRKPPNPLIKTLARLSKNYRESYNKASYLTIHDKDGKKIGNAQFWLKSKDELYLNWIDVNKSARGRGYATAVVKDTIAQGKHLGVKKVTLEVPGISPDARHVYEKIGFKVTKEADPEEIKRDPVWGGLTSMEYKYK